MSTAPTEQILTVPEVAARLGVSPEYVYRHANDWDHLRFGRTIRFTETQVAAILTKATKTPAQPAPHTKYGTRARRNK
jgi:excisionase family DNA binding protein